MAWTQVVDLSGTDGVSVDGAEIRDGILFLLMTDGSEVQVGNVVGPAGGGIDFETSVATEAELPSPAPGGYGEARYVRDVGHLFVYEEGLHRDSGEDGWTDVGQIRGETGAAGTDGVDVQSATVDGTGVLVLTLSDGGTITAGSVIGPKGSRGEPGRGVQDVTISGEDLLITYSDSGTPVNLGRVVGRDGFEGPQGARGPGMFSVSTRPSDPGAEGYIAGDLFLLDGNSDEPGAVYEWDGN